MFRSFKNNFLLSVFCYSIINLFIQTTNRQTNPALYVSRAESLNFHIVHVGSIIILCYK